MSTRCTSIVEKLLRRSSTDRLRWSESILVTRPPLDCSTFTIQAQKLHGGCRPVGIYGWRLHLSDAVLPGCLIYILLPTYYSVGFCSVEVTSGGASRSCRDFVDVSAFFGSLDCMPLSVISVCAGYWPCYLYASPLPVAPPNMDPNHLRHFAWHLSASTTPNVCCLKLTNAHS